ncbi:hypothetical protein [Inquilinus sp. OTU3971]|uniref:hypothetical protein n=1 Tax=Inquilinus sp. OTU3971 TaxID=3043855 RepID=UPI00313B354B
MDASHLWLHPDDPTSLTDEPPPYPTDHAEIFEQVSGRIIGRWNPRTETVEALSALLDRLFAETQRGPDMHCLPTVDIDPELEPRIYAMDHRGMCLVVSALEPIMHIDRLRRQLDRTDDV